MAARIEIGHCAAREEMQSLCLLGYSLQTKLNKLQQKSFIIIAGMVCCPMQQFSSQHHDKRQKLVSSY